MKPWLLLTLLPPLLAACSAREPEPQPVRPVLTQVVTPGAAITRDIYAGEIRARHETDLGFRVGGKLVARTVDGGSRVRRGQVLARLDPEDARLTAQSAVSQRASADSELALARAELERHADLLAKKFISQSAFDVKQNALTAARARADQARSQSAIASNQAAYTTLVAEADGVVVSVAAEPGQVLAAGQPVLRLARDGEKEVVLNAPESQLGRFKVGEAVSISLWALPGQTFAGRVREVAGGADPVTRTYAVRVSATDAPSEAKLGMTANALFATGEDAKLVLLPLAALARERDAPAVWIVDPATRKVKLRPVTVGQFREDGVTITSGLAAGEVVVTAGVHKLRADQEVRLASAAPLPATAPRAAKAD